MATQEINRQATPLRIEQQVRKLVGRRRGSASFLQVVPEVAVEPEATVEDEEPQSDKQPQPKVIVRTGRSARDLFARRTVVQILGTEEKQPGPGFVRKGHEVVFVRKPLRRKNATVNGSQVTMVEATDGEHDRIGPDQKVEVGQPELIIISDLLQEDRLERIDSSEAEKMEKRKAIEKEFNQLAGALFDSEDAKEIVTSQLLNEGTTIRRLESKNHEKRVEIHGIASNGNFRREIYYRGTSNGPIQRYFIDASKGRLKIQRIRSTDNQDAARDATKTEYDRLINGTRQFLPEAA